MTTKFIGKNIIKLDSVDSTNNYLVSFSKNNKTTDGTIIISQNQTDGRGNADNYWESEKGKNLTFSLLLYPEVIQVSNHFCISKAISLSIVDFLKLYTDNISVKWPNDIYVNDKKIAGTLIENFISGNIFSKTIIGIGLNINQVAFKSDAPNPVSLKNITNIDFNLNACMDLLLAFIETRYYQLKTIEGINKINTEYLKSLYKFNVFAKYESNSEIFNAKIIDVEDSGKLIVVDENLKKSAFNFKEIKFI